MSPSPIRHAVIWLTGGTLLLACGTPPVDKSPVGAAKRFVVAVQDRDTEVIYKLLGPATQARLKASAGRATAQGGGTPKREPHEMLSPAWRPRSHADWAPKSFKLLKKSDKTATVEIRGAQKGQRAVLTLVRVQGEWRVEFDQPPLPRRAAP